MRGMEETLGPQKEAGLPTLELLASRVVRHYNSVVYITPFVLFCYDSLSKLIQYTCWNES